MGNLDSSDEKKRFTPIIIARNEQQKRVYGLGYPSIPTVTVDEWFQGMVDNGKFGKPATSTDKKNHADDEDEEETVKDDDVERHRLQKWDEYKDGMFVGELTR